MGQRVNRLSVGDVRYALKHNRGLLSYAAKFLGVSPQTLGSFVENHQELKITINEERSKFCDLAELKLIEKVESGSEPSILFVMRTLAKDRGYGDKVELSTSSEGIKLRLPKDFPDA